MTQPRPRRPRITLDQYRAMTPLERARLDRGHRQRLEAGIVEQDRRRRDGPTPAQQAQIEGMLRRAQERARDPEGFARARAAERARLGEMPTQAQQRRARRWDREAPERRRIRQEFGREAMRALRAASDAQLSGEARDRMEQANMRALLARGIGPHPDNDPRNFDWIIERNLHIFPWDNRGLQSLLRKWDGLMRQGLTKRQAIAQLEARVTRVQRARGDNINPYRLLDIVREHYGADRMGRPHSASHLAPIPESRRRRPRGRRIA